MLLTVEEPRGKKGVNPVTNKKYEGFYFVQFGGQFGPYKDEETAQEAYSLLQHLNNLTKEK